MVVTLMRRVKLTGNTHGANVLIRQSVEQGKAPIVIRVAVVGNVDSGKSTLVGVLTRSILDDGRGFARLKIFK